MATKPFVAVTLMLHDVDIPKVFADYVDDDGKFINIGTQAAAAIARREAVHIFDDGVEYIIPFHAIVGVFTTKNSGEYTAPEDDFCQPIAECTGTITVTWKGEGIEETTETYACGEKPTYKGEYPQGCSSPQWSNGINNYEPDNLPPLTEDITYTLNCGK